MGSFKPGAFGAAARVDVEVWVLAIAGARCGRPRLALERLCESSAAFCGNCPEGEQPQDFLAARAQASTQQLLDALLAKPAAA